VFVGCLSEHGGVLTSVSGRMLKDEDFGLDMILESRSMKENSKARIANGIESVS
jgi:hypothetical protein